MHEESLIPNPLGIPADSNQLGNPLAGRGGSLLRTRLAQGDFPDTGPFTGNFFDLIRVTAWRAMIEPGISNACIEFPCTTEQGIILPDQRIVM